MNGEFDARLHQRRRRNHYRRRTGRSAAVGAATPLFAQARTKLRVGYLHTPAVDGQIWLGQQSGAWAKRRLDLELLPFTTGLELFQAMIGGSLDVLTTGAVVSNFPARGQGKVFLVNDIEYGTAQLWVRDESIKTVADLKGKVLTFLGARDGAVNREQIRISQVLYAMVCPTTAAP